MVQAVLADYRTAPIDEKLRAMLGFLEKMTLRPSELTPADAEALRAHGLSDEAIYEAMHVAFLFNIYDRAADALGFNLPDDGYKMAARFLLTIGYR
jgi:uncharacterized peroxidase-related enzyme